MLNDKQSIALTGLLAAGIFIFGILGILENFLILTILTIVFFTIIINIFYSKFKSEDANQEKDKSK